MRKKVSSITLLALVASMIVGSIPNHVYADSQSDSLIRIATQARDQLKIQLSKIDVSEEIQEKFELGATELDLLIETANKDDVSAARQHFLSAMKIFNEIILQISEPAPTSEAALSASQSASMVSHELDRLEKYLDRLEEIADKNGIETDSLHIDELIDKAKSELRERNSDAVYSTIKEIKRSIIELEQTLREKTRQYTTDRAKSFAEKYLEVLENLIAQAEDIEIPQETIDRLIEARENLNLASDASDVQQIIDEVKRIISVKQQFEDTKIQRLEDRINHLKSEIDRLSNYSDEIPELDNAESMLSELIDLVSKRSLDEAIIKLNSLNNLINEIESSLSQDEAVAESEIQQSSSIADSKTERIKIKIQRLETTLEQLAEEVEENAAAKRWLNNAFSLLENARNHVDDSPDNALEIITNIEKIIKRIQNTIQ